MIKRVIITFSSFIMLLKKISLFRHYQPSDIILIANTHSEGYTVLNFVHSILLPPTQ